MHSQNNLSQANRIKIQDNFKYKQNAQNLPSYQDQNSHIDKISLHQFQKNSRLKYKSIDNINKMRKQKQVNSRYQSIILQKSTKQLSAQIKPKVFKRTIAQQNNQNIKKPKSQRFIIKNIQTMHNQSMHKYINNKNHDNKQNNQPYSIDKQQIKNKLIFNQNRNQYRKNFQRFIQKRNNKKSNCISSARQLSNPHSSIDKQKQINQNSVNQKIDIQSARNHTISDNYDQNQNVLYKDKKKGNKKTRRYLTQICSTYRQCKNNCQKQPKHKKNIQNEVNQQIKRKNNKIISQKYDNLLKQQVIDISQIMQQNKYGHSNQQSILQNIGQLDTILSDYLIDQRDSKSKNQYCNLKQKIKRKVSNVNESENINQINKLKIKNYQQQLKSSNSKIFNKINLDTSIKNRKNNHLLNSLATLPSYDQFYLQQSQLPNYESLQSHRYNHIQSQNSTLNLLKHKIKNRQVSFKQKMRNRHKGSSNYQSNISIKINKIKQLKQFRTNVLVMKSIDRVKHIFPKGFF